MGIIPDNDGNECRRDCNRLKLNKHGKISHQTQLFLSQAILVIVWCFSKELELLPCMFCTTEAGHVQTH
jgi:hypothetical protein